MVGLWHGCTRHCLDEHGCQRRVGADQAAFLGVYLLDTCGVGGGHRTGLRAYRCGRRHVHTVAVSCRIVLVALVAAAAAAAAAAATGLAAVVALIVLTDGRRCC